MVLVLIAAAFLAAIVVAVLAERHRRSLRDQEWRADRHGLPDVKLAHEFDHTLPGLVNWMVRDDRARRHRGVE